MVINGEESTVNDVMVNDNNISSIICDGTEVWRKWTFIKEESGSGNTFNFDTLTNSSMYGKKAKFYIWGYPSSTEIGSHEIGGYTSEFTIGQSFNVVGIARAVSNTVRAEGTANSSVVKISVIPILGIKHVLLYVS